MPRGVKKTEEGTENTQETKEIKETVDTTASAAATGLSEDMVKQLMETIQKQQDQINEMNKKMEESIKASNVRLKGSVDTDVNLMSPDSYDNDDVMDEPKVYFTYSNGKTLFSYTDSRTRKVIDLPYGVDRPIKFKKVYAYRKTDRSGKGDKVHVVSRYVTYSKKEDEFLRNHPYFNISIFESMGSAESIDSSFATILESVKNQVNKMSNHAVVDRARRLSLDVLENPSEMRKSLIYKLAEEQKALSEKNNKSYVHESVSSRDIINKR